MKEGYIVKSLKGHDAERTYCVISEVNDDFVLVADGKYRTIENPKLKRRKHLEVISEGKLPSKITDSALRKICKQ